ncbi:MAG: amidase [Acidimicrobiales bacterium]
MSELVWRSARDLAADLAAGRVSAREVLAAHLDRIASVNPAVNAVVTLTAERAQDAAAAADEARARGELLGPLHGLPVAHKDLVLTKGVRTTFGSPIFAEFVPAEDALLVTRLRAAGAIALGKTNTPEFGAGSQTFNPVFGATRNPYDLSRTCGGSSGGAAAALASGMLPIADGSDLGGSLRNPASFCNVVGLRPTPGRAPSWPSRFAWGSMSVEGPMARSVADVGLLLSAMAGPDLRCPLSLESDPAVFAGPLDADLAGVRVAWSPTLGGLPVEPAVRAVIDSARSVLEALGCVVVEADPPLDHADRIFEVLRAHQFELGFGGLLERSRAQMKDTVVWNIEQGRALSGPEVGEAERLRSELYARWCEFFTRFDAVAAPVVQTPPFPIEQEWVDEIDGEKLATYLDWMKSCFRISVTSSPALSVPAGFTPEGLPVGLQLVGRPRGELDLLRLAHGFEAATGHGARRPLLP